MQSQVVQSERRSRGRIVDEGRGDVGEGGGEPAHISILGPSEKPSEQRNNPSATNRITLLQRCRSKSYPFGKRILIRAAASTVIN